MSALPPLSFQYWQRLYAEHRIATFPVEGKVPAISGWQRIGLTGSSKLAQKFAGAHAFGFCPGGRSRLTILDVDTLDERVLTDALDRYGPTPVIVRSGSGNFQAWYRHNGENRLIRPEPDRPIDILGSGFVVAPPSRGVKGTYQFIQGHLDDLDGLPTLQINKTSSPPLAPTSTSIGAVVEGQRNKALFDHCMRSAHCCDDKESLIDVARTTNAGYMAPLPDSEVVKIANSAWDYEERGENRFGQTGAWLPQATINALVHDPTLLALITWLKAANRPNAEFLVADGLCAPKYLGWPINRLRSARRRAMETGWIVKIRHEAKGLAALFRWGPAARSAFNW